LALQLADRWEVSKLRIWKSQGRITEDGVLRVNINPQPHTYRMVSRALPWLDLEGKLALLLEFKVLFEGEMVDAKEEVIRAVTKIIKDEMKSIITDEIKPLVRQAIGEVFAEIASNAPKGTGGPRGKRGPNKRRHPDTGEQIPKEEYDKIMAAKDLEKNLVPLHKQAPPPELTEAK